MYFFQININKGDFIMAKCCVELALPSLPEGICEDIIGYAKEYADSNTPSNLHGGFEFADKQSPVFIGNVRKYLRTYGIPKQVIIAELPQKIIAALHDFFDESPMRDLEWKVQIIRGGAFVAPHRDSSDTQLNNIVYTLQTGGSPTTTWWRVRDEQSATIPAERVVPFELIEPIEKHTLQLHKWYELDVSTIHSVGVQEDGDRIALSARVKI